MINFEDFQKVEIQIGTIIEAVSVENSEKLLKLTVDFGEEKKTSAFGNCKILFSRRPSK